jgi:hypothetical protein
MTADGAVQSGAVCLGIKFSFHHRMPCLMAASNQALLFGLICSSSAAAPITSLNPPIASAVPASSTARPPLQNMSPNKRRFNIAEDAAATKRSPAKRQPPPLNHPSPLYSFTREVKLTVINFIANRCTWVVETWVYVRVKKDCR